MQRRIGKLRPQLGFIDTLLQLWRAKWLMLLVFAPILLIGIAFALLTPPKYTANTRLLVRLGQEHVFDPVVGDAARGVLPQTEEVLQAEGELARSPVIAERTIRAVGLSRLYPSMAEAKLRARDGAGYVVDQDALEAFARDLGVVVLPKSAILHMTFAHEDPRLAAETLNQFVSEYQAYRQEVLSGQGVQGLSEQRRLIEQRYGEAGQAMRDWLVRNGLSDFEAERAAAIKLFGDIADERAKVEASLREAEARAAALTRQLAATPREVDLYVETTSEQALEKLRLEREDLLTRYLPDSRAVKDVERRIEQLQTYLASAPAQGLRRIGPNPTWQALEADRGAQQASIAALAGRLEALSAQRREVEARIRRLDALEPDYLHLKRDREAIAASAAAFATREQAERTRAELAARRVDNISVYEPARAPTRGDDARRIILVAAAICGLIAAFALGLLRAWTLPALPTAASIQRTLGLPVLAATRER